MNEFYIKTLNNKNEVVIINENNFKVNEKTFNAEILKIEENTFLLTIHNKKYRIISNEIENGDKELIINGLYLKTNTKSAIEEKADKLLSSVKKTSGIISVKAPMPGMIVKILMNENSEIEDGDSIIVLEAMKMENNIKAVGKGKILKIYIKEGEAVEKGTKLFEIEEF